MNKKSKFRSQMTTGILLVAAVLLLMGSVAGGSQAALTYFSETYKARILIYDIGVTLVENEKDISWRDYTGADDKWDEHTGVLLEYMLETEEEKEAREAARAKDEKVTEPELILGKAYKEELTVRNSGNIDQYVRVMVYRYWNDEDGNLGNIVKGEQNSKNINSINQIEVFKNNISKVDKTSGEYYVFVNVGNSI